MKSIFIMERYCAGLQKRRIFCQNFLNCIVSSSSVARMRAEREHLQRKRKRVGEWERDQTQKEAQRDANRNPVRVGPPDPCPKVLHPLSTVARAGSQMSVLTYAPMSSLSPLPGPDLWWRISMASLTFRLYARRLLFLSCMLVTTEKLALSNLCWQCWWCWVMPEWCHCSLEIALACSSHLIEYDRPVWPMYMEFGEQLHVYL